MSVEPEAARAPRPRARFAGFYVLLVVAGLLLLLSSFAVWINRVALNTEVFTDTSSELLDNDEIRSAVATRVVDELYASVDVQAELEQQLPDDFQALSGPAAAGLREASYRIVDRALEQPRFQALFAEAVRASHETLVQVLEGNKSVVSTEGGVVTLDLEAVILEAADRIGLRDQVQDNLPENIGKIEILQSNELDTAQDAFQLLKTLAWVLPILTLLAFAGAVWILPDRRRALRGVGITAVVVGVLGLLAANLTGNYVVNALVEERDTRPAANNAWDILTDLMRSSFRWLVVIGILFVVAWWLAGHGRSAIAVRRTLAPTLRGRWWAYAALAVVGLVLLVTGQVSDFARLLVVAILVALGAVWIELTRTQALREFPDAGAPAFIGDARTRVESWWDARRTRAEAPAVAASEAVSAQLANLAGLHAQGALTDEEFAAAKARVLAGE